jgi:hypothetical protein
MTFAKIFGGVAAVMLPYMLFFSIALNNPKTFFDYEKDSGFVLFVGFLPTHTLSIGILYLLTRPKSRVEES